MEKDTELITYENFEKFCFPKWEKIYDSDFKRIEKQESPKAIRSILDFKHRNLDFQYILLFSQFYYEQKSKSPKIPSDKKLELLPKFNSTEWNFTKAPKEQILCKFENEHYLLTSSSPLCKYHCIFVPCFNKQIPQILENINLILPALYISNYSKREDMKIYFNGYAAGASVNHFHYQIIYLSEMCNVNKFPIEILTNDIKIHNFSYVKYNIEIYQNTENIIPFIKFCLKPNFPEYKIINENYIKFATQIYELINIIYNEKCSINLLFANYGNTVFVIPRKKQETAEILDFGDGVVETAGIGTCTTEKIFKEATKLKFENHIKGFGIEKEIFDKILKKFNENINK